MSGLFWILKIYCKLTVNFFCIFLEGLECVGHSFTYVAYSVFLSDVWIRTQRAAIAVRRATNLSTHLHDDKLTNPAKIRSLLE
jgi:hypothetical protein